MSTSASQLGRLDMTEQWLQFQGHLLIARKLDTACLETRAQAESIVHKTDKIVVVQIELKVSLVRLASASIERWC